MAESNLKLQFIEEIIVPNCFSFKLYDKNIIEISLFVELVEIEKKHLVYFRDYIKELGKGKKMLIYISTNGFVNINDEAKKYSASDEAIEYSSAYAIFIDSVPKKLIFNFVINIFKPKIPVKSFTIKENAIEWLLGLQSDF